MRSLSFLSFSFLVASFALAGCAVGSETPEDSTASQEVNGAGESVSISKDAKRDVPHLAMDLNAPKAGDRALVDARGVIQQREDLEGQLGASKKLGDVIRQREIGGIDGNTMINVDGTISEPGSVIKRIEAAGDGRAVIHQANGDPLNPYQLSDDPTTTVGVGGGDDKP